MRLKQYITEDTTSDPKDIINTLHTDCSDYFKHIKYGVKSFRGSKIRVYYKKIKPRKNRIPKDTPKKVHEYLDKEFKKAFGWNVRSEGVFATADLDTAIAYGTPYYFYPSNGFKMVYSDTIDDLTLYLEDNNVILNDVWNHNKRELLDGWKSKIDELGIVYEYKQGGPADINKALQTFNEVIFKCDFYYIVNVDFVTSHFNKIYNIEL
jgi:hypothetical protein